MKHRLAGGACLLLLGLGGCSERAAAPATTHATLPAGVAARVGGEDIRAETVARIARSQRLEPAEARERAIADALFAALARAEPTRKAEVTAAERSALARALTETFRAAALAQGPPRDDEIAPLTAERWIELDRPESVKVVHAVVLVEKDTNDAAARALAERLATAVRGAATADEFLRRAKAFPSEGQKITAERLTPCTADGRTWDPSANPPAALRGTFAVDFARAANALTTPGEQSGLVHTAFGYHVIQLEKRYPEQREPLEARRALLADAVLARRAKPEFEALLTRLRAETPVAVERAADELTALVPVGMPPVAP